MYTCVRCFVLVCSLVFMYNYSFLLLDKEQQLFVRLFLRKHHWIRVPKLSYPDISTDLSPLLHNLVREGFLCDGQNFTKLD